MVLRVREKLLGHLQPKKTEIEGIKQILSVFGGRRQELFTLLEAFGNTRMLSAAISFFNTVHFKLQ